MLNLILGGGTADKHVIDGPQSLLMSRPGAESRSRGCKGMVPYLVLLHRIPTSTHLGAIPSGGRRLHRIEP